MSQPLPNDSRGSLMSVGDFVCYTTKSQGSGLQFGNIHKIIEKPITSYRRDSSNNLVSYQDIELKIVVLCTDSLGNPIYNWDYDYASGQKVYTDIQTKSGRIDHENYKFLKI